MQEMSEVIRSKCCELGCYFPATYNVFGFVDNTMNATCRPGGDPTHDGTEAPRKDPLIQRAWYNGWKKLHCCKWQADKTVLPRGME